MFIFYSLQPSLWLLPSLDILLPPLLGVSSFFPDVLEVLSFCVSVQGVEVPAPIDSGLVWVIGGFVTPWGIIE